MELGGSKGSGDVQEKDGGADSKDQEHPAAGSRPPAQNLKEENEVGAAGESTASEKSNDADGTDRQGDFNLLQALLDKPTDQAGSHLDIPLDFIAESPAHVPSLGKLGGCSKPLKEQVHERLQKHKGKVMTELRRELESKNWGRTVLAATTRLDLLFKNIGADGITLLARWSRASGSLGSLQTLRLGTNKIGDAGMSALASAIASGSLPNLLSLNLAGNNIGKAGMQAFASAVASGSMANLESLYLYKNKIGDEGLKAFASAIASGSMASLERLYLGQNQIGDAGMSALAGAIASGSLGSLQTLRLGTNKIGDAGMSALASAIASGSLGKLEHLDLNNNLIGNAGMTALAGALASGSLPALKEVYVDNSKRNFPQLVAACQQRGVQIQ